MKTKKTNTKSTKITTLPKGGLINFLINILTSIGNIISKLTPFVWILQLYFSIRSIILSFFTSFRVIRESFDYLNKLPVFQLMREIIRILSLTSLLLI